MYYALQIRSSNNDHPWYEKDTGQSLSNAVDYYAMEKTGKKKGFGMFVYDNANAPNKMGIVVGRKSTEEPFKSGKPNAIGYAPGPNGEIFILTDLPQPLKWELGLKPNAPGGRWDGNTYLLNMTHVIGHEAGHCFGFGHFDDAESIMHSTLQDGKNRWDTNNLTGAIKDLVKKLY
jgi:hypothetical protein